MYKTKHKMPVHFEYDLMIIGTGAGGGVAAHIAAASGKKVAVVEAEKIGGECPNFGCVPTKALLQAAETYKVAQEGAQFGIKSKELSVDYTAVNNWRKAAVKHTGTSEGEDLYDAEGIEVIHGYAHFIDPWTVSVGGKGYRARKFLLATGTRPVEPPIPGLKDSGYITYYEAIGLEKLPKSIFVIGGGAIGCEFAELFSSFGVKVHIAELAPRLCALEDAEVGDLLGALFESRGIGVHAGVKVNRITKSGSQKTVFFEQDGQTKQITVDEILLASGKAPNTDLGLENANVKYTKTGITTDKYMRTTNKHIYAAGDCVGPYRFTHTAAYQSRLAIHNMYHTKHKKAADYRAVPRCVFVDPEIACVGPTEEQLKAKGVKYKIGIVPIGAIGRANTSNQDSGFVKVIINKKGRLLSASILSPRAGEMIHELTLAVQRGLNARAIAETIHAFPTWSEAVRLACQNALKK